MTLDWSGPVAAERLPAATRLGAVDLTVRDLDRSVAFYRDVIGLTELGGQGPSVPMGSGDAPLVFLHEDRQAAEPGRSAGLYHVALNYPDRLELSRAAQRLAHRATPIQGASDHRTHEAIYLADPDGNGLELASDRERSAWPDLSKVENIRPRALDIQGLLELSAAEPLSAVAAAGTRVGHLHLHLGDLEEGRSFYEELIGFDTVTVIAGQAIFLAAGGYHHHLAFNLWRGRGIPAQPAGVVGLRHWSIVVPDQPAVELVRARLDRSGQTTASVPGGFSAQDPGGITVHVLASTGPREP